MKWTCAGRRPLKSVKWAPSQEGKGAPQVCGVDKEMGKGGVPQGCEVEPSREGKGGRAPQDCEVNLFRAGRGRGSSGL